MNPRLQTALLIIGALGSLAGVGNFAYDICDRMGCWKHPEASDITVNPCPPILPPGEVCTYPYPNKTSDKYVN